MVFFSTIFNENVVISVFLIVIYPITVEWLECSLLNTMCRGSRLAPVFFQYVFSHDEELLLNNGGLGYIPSLLSKFYVIGVMHFSNK